MVEYNLSLLAFNDFTGLQMNIIMEIMHSQRVVLLQEVHTSAKVTNISESKKTNQKVNNKQTSHKVLFLSGIMHINCYAFLEMFSCCEYISITG